MTVIKSNGSTLKSNDKILNYKWSVGEGLKFDGVNDYVSLGNILDFNISSEFSINIIFKAFDLTVFNLRSRRLFSKILDVAGNAFGYNIAVTINQIFIEFIQGSGNYMQIQALHTFNINQLYNITLIKRTGIGISNIDFYVDGILKNTIILGSSGIVTSFSNIGNTIVGAYCGSTTTGIFNGLIFDTKVFNKALTQEEVTELYIKQGKIVPATVIDNLQLDMRFDDKSGTIAKDQSGNVYNGTLTNFTNTSLGVNNSWVDKYGNSITQN